MNSNLLIGILGGLIGVVGGLIGTYYSVTNTRNRIERAFVTKCAIGIWIAVFAFLALLFAIPAPYKWLLWIPYAVVLPLAIRWMNKTQFRLRSESDPGELHSRT